MPVHKLPLIMVSNVQENASFIHKFWKISPRSLALPPLTNLGYTTVTGIAKMHKGAMPPPIDRRVKQKKKERKKENVSLKQIH